MEKNRPALSKRFFLNLKGLVGCSGCVEYRQLQCVVWVAQNFMECSEGFAEQLKLLLRPTV